MTHLMRGCQQAAITQARFREECNLGPGPLPSRHG